MNEFINRVSELKVLDELWLKDEAQFALLYGRRRVGKTFLLQNFFNDKPHAFFLANKASISDNIFQMASAVLSQFPNSGLLPSDLVSINSILRFLSSQVKNSKFGLVIDEFQYLSELDASIPSQIQAWWDTDGIRSGIFLVLCGSHLGIMRDLAASNAPLFGRFNFRHKLSPMTYKDIASFYSNSAYISPRDILTAYSVLGGTPRYHAIFNQSKNIKENICNEILSGMGLLRNEVEVLLLSGQIRDLVPYNSVLAAIARGCTKPNDIMQRTNLSSSALNYHLNTLIEMEWINKEYPFMVKKSQQVVYKVTDNYINFYYRFVAPNLSRIEFEESYITFKEVIEPYLDDFIGRYAFEGICLDYLKNNAFSKHSLLIKNAGRYWSRDGKIEIDIIAELDNDCYLYCECKWSSSPVGRDEYYKLREKASAFPFNKPGNNNRFAIFSLAGFKKQLSEIASQDNLILIDGSNLLK